MGTAFTIGVAAVKSVLGLATQVKTEDFRETNRAAQKELDRLGMPTTPPKFFPDLITRAKNVKEGPYTIDAIRESLVAGVLPSGYAADQLRATGFKTEIEAYEKLIEKELADLRRSFSSTLDKLVDAVDSDLMGIDNQLKRAYATAGVTQKTTKEFRKIAADARSGMLTIDGFNAAIKRLQTLLEIVGGETDRVTALKVVQTQINDAEVARTQSLNKIAARFILKT